MYRIAIVAMSLIHHFTPLTMAQNECVGTPGDLRIVADGHLRAGRLAQAEQVARDCLAAWTRTLPAGHEDLTSAKSYLGLLVMLSGRPLAAEALLREAYQEAQAKGSPSLQALVAAHLGSFFRHQGEPARALPLLRAAHQRMIDAKKPTGSEVGLILMEIGAVQAEDRKFALAEKTFLEAIPILEKEQWQPEANLCAIYIAAMQVEQGRLSEAEPRLRRAIEKGRDPSAITETAHVLGLYHMARLQRRKNQPAEADAFYRAAIAGYEQVAIPPFPHFAEVLDEYSHFLKHRHHPEAKSWAAKAKAYRSK